MRPVAALALPAIPDHLVSQAQAFGEVLMIDLVLAGDNAVAVGLAASGLAVADRKKVILWGLAAAVALRIGFALITVQLLAVLGLLLAGGLLLLWVAWRMWREMAAPQAHGAGEGEAEFAPDVKPAKSFRGALLQILVADLSMSLDNVLAVAGAAREHPSVLVFGLILSIALMGVAANFIARLLNKHRWIGFVGLAIVLWVALGMIWEGHRQVVIDLGKTPGYNEIVPTVLEIGPEEASHRLKP